jgi:hypothetical protein
MIICLTRAGLEEDLDLPSSASLASLRRGLRFSRPPPEILIEIVVSNAPTNLIEDGIDFWIHGFELSELQPDLQEGCRDLSRNRCDSDIP